MSNFFKASFFLITSITWGQKTLQYADSIRIAKHIPEISYAVIDDKSIFEIEAIGFHSINLNDKATLNDRFHIGSNTKAMTAFVIAKYVELGKLQWSTKFFDVFPEWKQKSKPEYFNITLQELLSHRAGIQPLQGNAGFENEEEIKLPQFKGTNQEKRNQYGRFVFTLEPAKLDENMPFVYSNAGYVLATLMVEKTTGKSWEQLVEKVFNKDLKLHVKLSWPENQKKKDTWGHTFENDTLKPVPSTTNDKLDIDQPAGDINIRLKDYVKFIQLNLQGLKGENNYLKASTYQFLHKGVENYSMGWFNIYENGKEFSTHAGTVGTYYTLVHIDRTKNKAYIIFTNSFNLDTQEGVKYLMRKLKANY